MLKNLFTTASRSLLRNKSHALLNLAGLALGITCCLMIFLVVRYELSFDTFHAKADRLYRVTTITQGDEIDYHGTSPYPMGETVQAEFPEVEQATTVTYIREGSIIKANEKLFRQTGLSYVAPSFFALFDYEWVAGDPQKSLTDPYSMVLTETVARKYFGGEGAAVAEAALNQVIRLNDRNDYKVTGIVKDFPENTDFPFQVLMSFSSIKAVGESDLTSWVNLTSAVNHYVLLREGADPAEAEARFPALLQKYMSADDAAKRSHLLQPLRELHFDDRYGNYSRRAPSKVAILSLSLVGLFLLLTACINFINLTTAQSVKRSKEVGVRKVLGAGKGQLIRQFMAETVLLTVAAIGVAVILTEIFFPSLLQLMDLRISFSWFIDPTLPLFLLGLTLLVSLLAGFYPALVLSDFQPILALKNKISGNPSSGLSLRRGLIVFQFVISQVLIIGTLVVARQLDYFRTQPLGYVAEAIVTVSVPRAEPTRLQTFRTQLSQIAGVERVSLGRFNPSSESNWTGGFNFPGSGVSGLPIMMRPGDPEYIKTYGLTLLAGRDLRDTDSLGNAVIANETLLRRMNIQDPLEAVGKTITVFDEETTIVGVVKDYHGQSLRESISPAIIFNDPGGVRLAALKVSTQDVTGTLAQVEQVYRQQFPESIYEHQFLDETIAGFYESVERLSQVFTVFSGIAIFIGCLGLYGLISFLAVQRTKEIGVRKVLGASVFNIVYLFTKEFFVLIGVAFAIAAPLAWYVMQAWLQDFEYRIPLGPGLFVVAVAFTVVIAALTVGYRSLRAALANPVESLKTE
jgi:putative ABC transport system permease protein